MFQRLGSEDWAQNKGSNATDSYEIKVPESKHQYPTSQARYGRLHSGPSAPSTCGGDEPLKPLLSSGSLLFFHFLLLHGLLFRACPLLDLCDTFGEVSEAWMPSHRHESAV